MRRKVYSFWLLLDDIILKALDECDYVALFGLGTLNFVRVAAAGCTTL